MMLSGQVGEAVDISLRISRAGTEGGVVGNLRPLQHLHAFFHHLESSLVVSSPSTGTSRGQDYRLLDANRNYAQ